MKFYAEALQNRRAVPPDGPAAAPPGGAPCKTGGDWIYWFKIDSEVTEMAESNLTKRVLAAALKELVGPHSYEKVSVIDICEACGVSRKTFYYHFKDKYDLTEWIFETEFIATLKRSDGQEVWHFVGEVCQYFYKERAFYGEVLKYQGQNSFQQYFQGFMFETMSPFFLPDLKKLAEVADQDGMTPDEMRDFYVHFLSDAVLLSILRWLTGGAKLPPEQFVARLKSVSELLIIRIQEELK